jgi:hypothetical protein
MELDDLKQGWQTLGNALARQSDLAEREFRARKLDRARSSLRSLVAGQALQIAFGTASVVLGVSVWHRHVGGNALFASGVVIHVYGVLLIASAAIVLGLIGRIDYTAPVLAIQQALARLRRIYVITSLALGLAWWLLWIPYALAGFDLLFGVDLYPHMRGPVWWMVASGVAGLALTLALIAWSLHAAGPRLARALDDTATGFSLRRARAHLDELATFAAE